ncbi:hypothetical protein DPMN_141115 [Dreissena polymorpha]|uniref:Uncharacterized protein n=1 Tax=Dreissena polymorpha TaxID=45954 RepID=A0A9D4JMB6_DREPO|nr:hypothetical protein DPMN_141115 [Dreissena polymorpha]
MCQLKSVHPALIAICPPNNADPAAYMPLAELMAGGGRQLDRLLVGRQLISHLGGRQLTGLLAGAR